VDSLRVGDFHLTEAAYPSRCLMPPHRHESAYITFVVCGGLEEEVGGRSEQFDPGGMMIKPAGEVHSNRFGDAGAKLLLVEVLPTLSQGSPGVSRLLDQVVLTRSPRLSQLMLQVHQELRSHDDFSELCVQGLLFETFAELGRTTARRPAAVEPYLERVRERLHAEFTRPLRIADLAREESVSTARLARQFRARFGRGIGEYLRQVRLDWVAQALLQSDRPIALLALEAGFADQSHLTRDFRRRYGVTPGVFRRTRREPGMHRDRLYHSRSPVILNDLPFWNELTDLPMASSVTRPTA
jgi:AraC family transcriptional regulator